mgnify:CR=1 FL=1
MFGLVPQRRREAKNYDIYIETIKVSSLESTNKVFAMLQFKENWYWAIDFIRSQGSDGLNNGHHI